MFVFVGLLCLQAKLRRVWLAWGFALAIFTILFNVIISRMFSLTRTLFMFIHATHAHNHTNTHTYVRTHSFILALALAFTLTIMLGGGGWCGGPFRFYGFEHRRHLLRHRLFRGGV